MRNVGGSANECRYGMKNFAVSIDGDYGCADATSTTAVAVPAARL
jgi:hypothetical protein